jgi:hypothetical protein
MFCAIEVLEEGVEESLTSLNYPFPLEGEGEEGG